MPRLISAGVDASAAGNLELGLRTDGSGQVNRVSVLQMENDNDNAFSACTVHVACIWQVDNWPSVQAGDAEAHLSFLLSMRATLE